tara:strand:+ start:146 stop:736 length:591 start_codon:yes stop_codon:yes gene_type:complete
MEFPSLLEMDEPNYQHHWLAQHQKFLTRVSPLLISIAFITVGLVLWANGALNIQTAGYPSLFVAAFLGSSLLFLPVSALLGICAGVSMGLNPFLAAAVAASAEAIGEMTGYLAGMGGSSLFERNRFYLRFKKVFTRYSSLCLFVGGLIPNPFFDCLGIAAGSIRYSITRFLLILFISKTLKFTWVGLGCYYGVTWF